MPFKLNILLALTLATLLAACSQPKDTVIPFDAAAWDKELMPKIQKLPADERQLLGDYLIRAKLGEAFGAKPAALGVTVGQAIEDQRSFAAQLALKAAEEQALKEKLQQERAQAAAALNSAVTVTLLEKSQRGKDYEVQRYIEQQVFKIGIKNTSAKELAGVKGTLEFIDIFGKRVGAVSFGIAENIPAGEAVVWTGSRDYNQFLDEHRAVWNLAEGKYTTRFVPDQVVYADGTKLGTSD